MQLLWVVRLHNREGRLPARRHFVHDRVEGIAGRTRFRFHRFRAGIEDQTWPGREGGGSQEEENRDRDPEHDGRAAHGPFHVVLHETENPIVALWMALVRQENEEDRDHEESGEEDADGDQNTELGEAGRAAQEQRQKADRGGKRAEKDVPPEILDRQRDRFRVIFAIVARLLITAENQNGEVDAETDEDRAKTDRHHVELAKNQESGRERDEAAKEK